MLDRETPSAAAPEPIFEIHTGPEIQRLAKKVVPAKLLCGDLWAEGEMAILFGDHGTGKSILAAQIADGIAHGSGDGPFEVTARRQKVLFLDLEQKGSEFAARHAAEDKSHKFSTNFVHVSVDPFTEVPDGYKNFIDYLTKSISRLVREHRPKTIILDSLAQLRRSNDITRDVLPLLREFGRLKREFGLSILLVAPAQRRVLSKNIEIGDMQASRGLCAFADSIFAIGVSGGDTGRRYLKQLKARRREILYDRSHTIGVRIGNDAAHLLSCHFTGFAPESEHSSDISIHRDAHRIAEAKRLADLGYSFSEIALDLGVSKTTAHRLVQMWRPGHVIPNAPETVRKPVPLRSDNFPGCDEYLAAEDAADRGYDLPDDDPNAWIVCREAWIISKARLRAFEEFKRTGKAPPLSADVEYAEFIRGRDELAANAPWIGQGDGERLVPESEIANNGTPEEAEPHVEKPVEKSLFPGTTVELNAHGKEIWVESRDVLGRPDVWYMVDSKGRKRRHFRDGLGVSISDVAPENEREDPVDTDLDPLDKS